MVVAVMKGLNGIKDNLRNLGYEVVTYGEYNYPIDAIVYTSDQLWNLNISPSNVKGNTSGVITINARHKSISDIDSMLKRKIFSPLF